MIFCVPLVLTGCLATRQEIEDLRVDISRLQTALGKAQQDQAKFQSALEVKQDSVQGNQADLLSQMDSLKGSLTAVSSQLEDNSQRFTNFATRVDDLDKNLTARLDLLSQSVAKAQLPPPPPPSKLFALAKGDLIRRRYEAAAEQLAVYVQKYGDTTQAPQAQLYLGQALYAQRKWAEALTAFDGLATAYPKSRFLVSALLQKGLTLQRLNRPEDAAAVYESVVDQYAGRPEAATAAQRLKNIAQPLPENLEPVVVEEDAPKPKPKPAAPKPKPKPKPATP